MKNSISGFIYGDTETTGVSFLNSEVIQFACLVENTDFEPLGSLSLNINLPEGAEWTKGAEKVHGISKETAMKHGVSQSEAIVKINSFLDGVFGKESKNARLVGANSYFDFVMLQNMYSKNKSTVIPWSYRMIDVNQAGLHIGSGSKLHEILKHFNIPVDNDKAHEALYDAELHRSAFHALHNEYKKRGLSFF